MKAWLLESLGAEAFMKLSQAFGGNTLSIPNKPEGAQFNHLAVTIGAEAAKKLVKIAAGDRLYISHGALNHRAERRLALQAMRAEGMSVSQIQKVWREPPRRLSDRQIRKYLSEPA